MRRCLPSADMEKMLHRMEADYAAAQERLAQTAMNERSLANVEKGTPM